MKRSQSTYLQGINAAEDFTKNMTEAGLSSSEIISELTKISDGFEYYYDGEFADGFADFILHYEEKLIKL